MCETGALRTTPAVALRIADRVWTIGETIGDLLDAALTVPPADPTTTAPGSAAAAVPSN